MSGIEDADQQRRKYKAPYTPHNPIPTIQQYREEQKERRDEENAGIRSNRERAEDAYRSFKDEDKAEGDPQQVYPTNQAETTQADEGNDGNGDEEEDGDDIDEEEAAKKELKDTSEAPDEAGQDAKDKRKSMKKKKGGGEREVTDPVTHLPISIRDFTGKDLGNAPENLPPLRRDSSPDDEEIVQQAKTQAKVHRGMENLFPSPDYDAVGQQVASLQSKALTIGLVVVLVTMVAILLLEKLFGLGAQLEAKVLQRESAGKSVASIFLLLAGTAVGLAAIWLVRGWTDQKIKDVWDRHIWEAQKQQGKQRAKGDTPESTQWLCELLSSVWPLVNPDLFTR